MRKAAAIFFLVAHSLPGARSDNTGAAAVNSLASAPTSVPDAQSAAAPSSLPPPPPLGKPPPPPPRGEAGAGSSNDAATASAGRARNASCFPGVCLEAPSAAEETSGPGFAVPDAVALPEPGNELPAGWTWHMMQGADRAPMCSWPFLAGSAGADPSSSPQPPDGASAASGGATCAWGGPAAGPWPGPAGPAGALQAASGASPWLATAVATVDQGLRIRAPAIPPELALTLQRSVDLGARGRHAPAVALSGRPRRLSQLSWERPRSFSPQSLLTPPVAPSPDRLPSAPRLADIVISPHTPARPKAAGAAGHTIALDEYKAHVVELMEQARHRATAPPQPAFVDKGKKCDSSLVTWKTLARR